MPPQIEYQSLATTPVDLEINNDDKKKQNVIEKLCILNDSICSCRSIQDTRCTVQSTDTINEAETRVLKPTPFDLSHFFEELIDIYHDGILDSKESSKYISREEKYYVRRWNGHQPLTFMPDENTYSPKKTLRRQRKMITQPLE